jgi:glycosyltransferase involved in cell wall biosynthesis
MDPIPNKSLEERIKVLHLIDSFDLGGAQTALFNWLEYHDRAKFAVELATFHADEQSLFLQRARGLGIALHLLSPRRWLPIYLLRLPWLLARNKYTVVHCHLFASNWIGKPLAKLFGVPVVISHDQCNDNWRVESPLVRLVDRWANLCADVIVAVAESIKDFLIKWEQVPSAKIYVMPNGVAESFAAKPRPAVSRVIGGAGRLTRQKNFHKFLAIAHALKALDGKYAFKVAGSGPLESELKRYADSLEVEVQWLGELPSLDEFFPEIDLFLLTSDFEGLPMVVLESLHQGVPVAATAVDGVGEEFGDTILSLSPKANPKECAVRIHDLLSDSQRLVQWTVKGQALIKERFSAERQMAQIEALYLRILRSK